MLRQLRQEGFSLTILQNGCRWFNEAACNTQLYHQAVAEHAADWVTFLDVDEFIDDRNASLKSILETAPPLVSCIRVKLTNDHPTGADDQDQLVLRSRVQWVEQRTEMPKVIVRGNLVNRNVIVQDGANAVQIDTGWTCPDLPLQRLTCDQPRPLPERSPFQAVVKFVRG